MVSSKAPQSQGTTIFNQSSSLRLRTGGVIADALRGDVELNTGEKILTPRTPRTPRSAREKKATPIAKAGSPVPLEKAVYARGDRALYEGQLVLVLSGNIDESEGKEWPESESDVVRHQSTDVAGGSTRVKFEGSCTLRFDSGGDPFTVASSTLRPFHEMEKPERYFYDPDREKYEEYMLEAFKAAPEYEAARRLGFVLKSEYDEFSAAGFEYYSFDPFGLTKVAKDTFEKDDEVVYNGKCAIVNEVSDGDCKVRYKYSEDGKEKFARADRSQLLALHPLRAAWEECKEYGFKTKAAYDDCKKKGFKNKLEYEECFRLGKGMWSKSEFDAFRGTPGYEECRALGFDAKPDYDAFIAAGFECSALLPEEEEKVPVYRSGDRAVHDGRLVQIIQEEDGDGDCKIRYESGGDPLFVKVGTIRPIHPQKLAHEECVAMGFETKMDFEACKHLGFETKAAFDECKKMKFELSKSGKTDYELAKEMGFLDEISSPSFNPIQQKNNFENCRIMNFDMTRDGREDFFACKRMRFDMTPDGKVDFEFLKALGFELTLGAKQDFEVCKKMGFDLANTENTKSNFYKCREMGFEQTMGGKENFYFCKGMGFEETVKGKAQFERCKTMGFDLTPEGREVFVRCREMLFEQTPKGKADFDLCEEIGFKLKSHFDACRSMGFPMVTANGNSTKEGKAEFDKCKGMGFELTPGGKIDYDTCKLMGFEIGVESKSKKDYVTCKDMGFAQSADGRKDFELCGFMGFEIKIDSKSKEDFDICRLMGFAPSPEGKGDFDHCRSMGFVLNEAGKEEFETCKMMGFVEAGIFTPTERQHFEACKDLGFQSTPSGKEEYDLFGKFGFKHEKSNFRNNPTYDENDNVMYAEEVACVKSVGKGKDGKPAISIFYSRDTENLISVDYEKLVPFHPQRVAFEKCRRMGFTKKSEYDTCTAMGFKIKMHYDECKEMNFDQTKVGKKAYDECKSLGFKSKEEYQAAKKKGYTNMVEKAQLLKDLKKTTIDEFNKKLEKLKKDGVDDAPGNPNPSDQEIEANWEKAFDALNEVNRLIPESTPYTINPIERVMDEFLAAIVQKNKKIEASRAGGGSYFNPQEYIDEFMKRKVDMERNLIEWRQSYLKERADDIEDTEERHLPYIKEKIKVLEKFGDDWKEGSPEYDDIKDEYDKLLAKEKKADSEAAERRHHEQKERRKKEHEEEMQRLEEEMKQREQDKLKGFREQYKTEQEIELKNETKLAKSKIDKKEVQLQTALKKAKESGVQEKIDEAQKNLDEFDPQKLLDKRVKEIQAHLDKKKEAAEEAKLQEFRKKELMAIHAVEKFLDTKGKEIAEQFEQL